MLPFSSSELAAMQAEATAALDSTCTIQRATKVSDGMGHKVATFSTLASNVPCALNEPTGGVMGEKVGKLADVSMWLLLLPVGTDIAHGDRVVIGSDTMDVQTVYKPRQRQVVLQVLVTEVR